MILIISSILMILIISIILMISLYCQFFILIPIRRDTCNNAWSTIDPERPVNVNSGVANILIKKKRIIIKTIQIRVPGWIQLTRLCMCWGPIKTIHWSIHLFSCLFIHLFSYLFIHLFSYLFIYLFIHPYPPVMTTAVVFGAANCTHRT